MSYSHLLSAGRLAALAAIFLFVSWDSSAFAQDYSFDARRIALGGAGGTPNQASKLVERQRRYRSILIPVGLVNVLSNVRVFFPNRDDFDFSRAVEFSASPFHFTFGRKDDLTARTFFGDIVHARLDSDLNTYRGYSMPSSVVEEGLLLETWGKTFRRGDDSAYQGLYVGAGPYLSARAHADFDRELRDVLGGSNPTYLPDISFGIGGGETDQLALAITGGYRARFPWFESGDPVASRNGVYVLANYHYLYGLRFDEFNANLRFDTDNLGLVLPNPPSAPFALDWQTSSNGRGMALDFGVAFVINRWDFGVGVGGVANRMEWKQITQHHVTLVSLFGGSEFIHVKLPVTDRERRFELPVTYTSDVAYHREKWSVLTEFSHGFQDNQFRAGLEYRLGPIELRGAGRYSQGWYPSAGAGFNITRNFGVDAAVFGTQTFLEQEPHLGLAISLRFDQR